MGLFDFFFGAKSVPIDDPSQLKQALFQAAARGDHKGVEKLCRTNRQAVLDNFAAWRKPPDEVRNDPAVIEGYVQALISIAQVFAQRLGSADLLNQLMGTPDSNPLLRWQEQVARAQALIADLKYPEARDLLADLLIDMRDQRGTGADKYQPITLGYLAECHFQCREGDKAIPHLQQALLLCVQQGDPQGIAAYLGSLYEVSRYLGQTEAAAGYAERLADALAQQGRTTEAARYRRQAGIIRAGEPLNRVVAEIDGARHELDEIGTVRDKRIRFLFERNRITLRPAEALTRQGEQLGSQGRHEKALSCFRAAAQADGFDPHARYLEGFTLLHLERYPQAIESYQAAEDLAPGWFHVRTNLWLAQQLALGHFGYDTAVACLVLEDSPFPPDEKARLAEQILTRAPNLAPAHLQLGKNLALSGRGKDAQAAYRQGLACAAEPDIKTRLLVELGVLVDDLDERASLLREAQTLNGNLVAAATATLALRALAASR
jgi:tetratricopeptide (TPR) repeat protein